MKMGGHLATGALWSALAKYSGSALQLLVVAILSRVLEPEDFGLVALILLISNLLNLLAESGISSALVQKKEITQEEASFVFWRTILISVFLSAVIVATSNFWGSFLGISDNQRISALISFNLLCVSASTVPLALLQRELKFKQISLIDIICTPISGTLAIALAFSGIGYWAILWQLTVTLFLRAMLLLVSTRWVPTLKMPKGAGSTGVFNFSAYVIGFNLVNYSSRNIDNLLIGKILGTQSLGHYDQAYRLMLLPVNLITGVVNSVLHPVLAKSQNDPEKVKETYLQLLKLVAFLAFPLSLLLWASAAELILVIYGPKWISTVSIFQILAPLAAIQPLISTTGSLFLAFNQPSMLFKVGLFNSAALCLGISIGIFYGLEGVAWGYLAAYTLIVAPLTLTVVAKELLEIKLLRVLSHLYLPIIATFISATILHLISFLHLAPSRGVSGILFNLTVCAVPSLLIFLSHSVVKDTLRGIFTKSRKVDDRHEQPCDNIDPMPDQEKIKHHQF